MRHTHTKQNKKPALGLQKNGRLISHIKRTVGQENNSKRKKKRESAQRTREKKEKKTRGKNLKSLK
jgi:hypothetical protein